MRLEERETTVNYTDADAVATVMSYNAAMAARLKRLLAEHPDEVTLVWESEGGVEVRLPKKWVRINPTRELSEKQREHLADMQKRFGYKRDANGGGENEQN